MAKEKREAFVFYRSYYEAMQFLPPEDQLAVYNAIFAYALNDEEAEVSGALAAVFQLIKHSLDVGKQKAENGRKGGQANRKQKEADEKQTEADEKQTEATGSDPEAIKNKKQEIENKKQKTRKEEQEIRVDAEDVRPPYGEILESYHDICVSFPRLRSIEGERRRAVKARWRAYPSLETFEEVFRMAESSPFLKGVNDRNWLADFDWMMKESNFPKILEGKYKAYSATAAERPAWRFEEEYFSGTSAYENMEPL